MWIPNVAIRRKPLRILDHLVLIGVAALPLAAFHRVAVSGSRLAPQAIGLAIVMLAVGYFLWWLPRIGARRGALGVLALPAFIALTVVYLYLAFLCYFTDPEATALVVVAQVIALIYITLRSSVL
jgi:hypothetical protein